MNNRILLFVLLMVCAASPVVASPPSAGVLGVWAYGDDVTRRGKLGYKQNNLRFFLGNEAGVPADSVTYQVMLADYDSDWVEAFAGGWYFYTDLPPGDYCLYTRCRTAASAEWGPVGTFRFSIVAPWWLTWWAKTLYALVAVAVAGVIAYLLKTRLNISNQLKIERENQRFRNEFVIHAASQFKTPLTVIRTVVEKLKVGRDGGLSRADVRHLHSSSEMLLGMVGQLVEFREVGRGIPYGADNALADGVDVPLNKDIKVLVAESDPELADVVRRGLLRFMDVAVASATGLGETVAETSPDAVVIDVDADPATAYDLVGQIKKGRLGMPVPVIIVSDFGSSREVLRAIRSDADDYLPKPFSCEVLAALVMKQIRKKRERGDESAPRAASERPALLEKKADKLFLSRLDKIVDKRLQEPGFDVNSLADDLGISRGQIYNKLKMLLGVSPVEYLRDRRLSCAASLLKKNAVSVKEVRFQVGMPDATYFNRRFKEKFGVCPSEYVKTSV